ncbi:AsmA-like C-terminal region-containing protein [Sulfitobacter sp. HNIBRBA3233]|uniref:YhdP family protein n=1 Tax=Sulfitobacter marinivivus TaxID=3158558 RepID=UPI0032DF8FC2
MAENKTPPDPAPEPERAKRAPRKRARFLLLRGILLAVWSQVVLVAVLAVLGLYFLYDRPIVAPDWVEDRIEARLASELPNARVSFGELRLIVEEGWRPRVRLRDVHVATLGGQEFLRLSEINAQLSMRALSQGRLEPKQINLRGVFATLIREESGAFALQAELGVDMPARRAENLGELVRDLDDVLGRPALSNLVRAEVRGLTLQYVDRRAGKAFTLDGGRVIARREEGALLLNADLALLGDGGGVTTLSANYVSDIGSEEAQFGLQLDGVRAVDIATQSPAFAWMGALRAPISGAVRSGVRADGTLAPLNATLQIGRGVVQPTDGATPVPFDTARSYFSYNAATGALVFDELSVQSAWGSARAEGTAVLSGLREGALQRLTGQFEISQISASPGDLFPEPVSFEGARVDFALEPDPFRLTIGELSIRDKGRTTRAFGELEAQQDGWHLALDARAPQISTDRVLSLWPEALKTKTRRWVAENLQKALVRNAEFALRLAPQRPPRSFLSFDFKEAQVRVMRTLPPISRASGHVTLEASRFVVALDSGRMVAGEGGALDISQSSFVIPDTRIVPNTPAEVTLNARSSLTAALWTLDREPMSVMSRAGLPVDLGTGDAVLSGTLAFPLRKGGDPSDVKFDFTGSLLDVDADGLIPGRTLAAERLEVAATNAGVSVGGTGALDGLGFDGTWQQPIGPGSDRSTWSGTARLTPQTLDRFNVALPPGTLDGASVASIDVTLQKGQSPRMSLRSDLRGMAVSLPPLGWRKPGGAAGRLLVDVTLGPRPEVTRLELSGAGLDARGSLTLAAGGGLERLRLDTLRRGDWLDVQADVIGQGPGRAPRVAIRGGTLDLRRAEFGGGGGGGNGSASSAPLEVALDRLQVSDTIWLGDMRGTFQTSAGLEGAFQGRLNGGAAVSGRAEPREGRTAVRLQAEDAGAVLRSVGLIRQAVGGALDLMLVPVGAAGAFDGTLNVSDISIRDAPAMAALVNAISVVGLINEMNGDGIYFDDVDAKFRLTPNRLTISDASAVGASLGLSMDGVFATDTGQIAMQGVITPVYLFNGIGSLLTRPGEGLIGFNYSLGGQAKDPEVSINPLSALAPGGLRDIFRAPKTTLPPVEGEPPAPRSAPPAPSRRAIEQNGGNR